MESSKKNENPNTMEWKINDLCAIRFSQATGY